MADSLKHHAGEQDEACVVKRRVSAGARVGETEHAPEADVQALATALNRTMASSLKAREGPANSLGCTLPPVSKR